MQSARRSHRFQEALTVYSTSQLKDGMRNEVKEAAKKEAVKAGALESSIEIVELEEIPLAYLPSNAVRFRVKAVGKLAAVSL